MARTMTDIVPIDVLDQDGAIREADDHMRANTRADFFRKAGVAGGSVVAGGAILGALPAMAGAKTSKGDVAILNYALTLEYLEAAFYNQATANNIVKDAAVKAFLDTVTADENAHVAYLKKALGRAAVKEPTFDFGMTVKDEGMFKTTALTLENTGVTAYLGQAGKIKNKKILGAAGSILTIEARHASVIGNILTPGAKGITPDGPFDKPASMKKVLAAVKGTGFITG